MKNNLILNRIIVLLLFAIIFNYNTYAQNKTGEEAGTGIIKGKVFDKESSAPLVSATIQLFDAKDSTLINGAETNSKGEFNIEIPCGRYNMKISYISYSTAIFNGILINSKTAVHDAGSIMLKSSITTTDVIEVTAEQSFMETQLDKKVFNVEKSLVSQGGTATDVLKNIPSVTVDADGNVSLRGSTNVKFLVNGKQSGLIGSDPANSLQQISANSIERIEVIDNPSAKYDPDGMSGIINIVMKKSEDAGYNASITLNGGTGDKYNPSFNINYKNKSFNIYGSYNYRLFNMSGNNVSSRQNTFGDSSFYFDQNSSQNFKMAGNMANFGFDYSIDNKNTLSLSGTYNNRDRSSIQTLLFKDINSTGNTTSQYTRYNNEVHNGTALAFTLSFDHKFDKPKQDLSGSVFFSSNTDNGTLNINQQNYLPADNPLLQNNYTNGKYTLGSVQFDYYQPLGNDLKSDSRLEFGYKGTLRNTSSDFRSETFEDIQNAFLPDVNLNNNFEYKEQIHSFYGLYVNNYKDFKYQAGLRLEEAITSSDLINTNQTYSDNYFSFFPSFYISQKFASTNEIQLNYSRRINRPNMHVLNPFIDYSDPYNLRQGNPNLKPEYINSFQLGYMKYFDFASVTSSVFYKQINDMISRITTVDNTGISMTTYDNLNSANSYGLEFTVNGNPLKWWNFNANATYFRTIINGSDVNAALNNDNYSYTAKLTSNFSVFKLFDLQVAYNFQGPTILAQGRMDPVQSFDMAIKKDILDNRGSIGFRVSDLFNQIKYSSQTSGPGFTQDMTRVRDSRVAFLTFSYRLGSDGQKNKPTRKEKPADENNNNESDY
ncbi:MAG: TonB-dependent receptor [Ignavibacteriae bacterium]|nr:TonB-dependent receptor [Ignavibacteriota bacterium]